MHDLVEGTENRKQEFGLIVTGAPLDVTKRKSVAKTHPFYLQVSKVCFRLVKESRCIVCLVRVSFEQNREVQLSYCLLYSWELYKPLVLLLSKPLHMLC